MSVHHVCLSVLSAQHTCSVTSSPVRLSAQSPPTFTHCLTPNQSGEADQKACWVDFRQPFSSENSRDALRSNSVRVQCLFAAQAWLSVWNVVLKSRSEKKENNRKQAWDWHCCLGPAAQEDMFSPKVNWGLQSVALGSFEDWTCLFWHTDHDFSFPLAHLDSAVKCQ